MLNGTACNETLLIQQLSQDHEEAFEEIYKFYAPRIYSKLVRMLKSEEIAQEILQDVFLIVWESRKKLDPEKSFSSYLFCIATNKCYDHFRKLLSDKKWRQRQLKNQTTELTIEDQIINKESAWKLYHAIDALPPRRKLVFRLCKVEGKSYEEVSIRLGISLSTISDHIVKANLFIRSELMKSVL
jgi:RNA polymerase sigma-70 factor (ECF subfamily)